MGWIFYLYYKATAHGYFRVKRLGYWNVCRNQPPLLCRRRESLRMCLLDRPRSSPIHTPHPFLYRKRICVLVIEGGHQEENQKNIKHLRKLSFIFWSPRFSRNCPQRSICISFFVRASRYDEWFLLSKQFLYQIFDQIGTLIPPVQQKESILLDQYQYCGASSRSS